MAEPRIHRTARMVALYDAGLGDAFDATWFDRAYWQAHGALIHSTKERGSVLKLDRGGETWVLRHYHRGGFIARFIYDRYLWVGWERTRALREWRLLNRMHDAGLPVPKPVAARGAARTGLPGRYRDGVSARHAHVVGVLERGWPGFRALRVNR